jgi:selenocysteine lyase/cysteine desulfurase
MDPEILPCPRGLFDIPDDVAYLNAAYMGPQTRAVTEAGRVFVSLRGDALRISAHVDNTTEEVDRLAGLLAGAL